MVDQQNNPHSAEFSLADRMRPKEFSKGHIWSGSVFPLCVPLPFSLWYPGHSSNNKIEANSWTYVYSERVYSVTAKHAYNVHRQKQK
jgi:hypothetical protein